ncbi:MAG: LPS export ABC transporter periplasmic protein LptC [Alphaproteobacteria bacterium]|nr:LPS export ABC transporter periplasmic protein LptC [Alphaproteobacteria bacterium]
MSDAIIPVRGPAPTRLIATGRARRTMTPGQLARRRLVVTWSKRLLPLLALTLLGTIAVWPELERQTDAARLAIRRLGAVEGNGRVLDARYQSVDEKGRPYTITAAVAVQAGPQRVNLTNPKGDVTMQNGAWLLVRSHQGVYLQRAGQLDLSGDVTLYRDDGTFLRSPTASIDLKRGAATSANTVSAEGPFGTLDATGFTLVDKGGVIQFAGPARLVLDQHKQ